MATANANVESKPASDAAPAEPASVAKNTAQDAEPAAATFADDRLPGAVEAILLTSDRPLSAGKIAEALKLEPGTGTKRVRSCIDELNEVYAKSDRSFLIENIAGGYRVMTKAEFAPAVAVIRGMRERQKLSRAAIETLAIVAYKQPITRAQIEAIRGVAAGEVLRGLLERRLISITGRAEELGRPMLYGTSKLFLETFGLSSPGDLPPVSELVVQAAELPGQGVISEDSDADPAG